MGARLPGVSSVRIDDVAAARSAVHHLLHQGHEKIAMITGIDDDRDFGFASSRDRREGYRQALASAGIAPQDPVVAECHGIEGGAKAMTELMAGPTLPTAIFAEYDELAIGALRTLRRAGIPVPGRVSVIGIDDHEMSSVVDLTTVAQPVQEQGAIAARLLLDVLRGSGVQPVDVVVPTSVTVRASTAPPPGS